MINNPTIAILRCALRNDKSKIPTKWYTSPAKKSIIYSHHKGTEYTKKNFACTERKHMCALRVSVVNA